MFLFLTKIPQKLFLLCCIFFLENPERTPRGTGPFLFFPRPKCPLSLPPRSPADMANRYGVLFPRGPSCQRPIASSFPPRLRPPSHSSPAAVAMAPPRHQRRHGPFKRAQGVPGTLGDPFLPPSPRAAAARLHTEVPCFASSPANPGQFAAALSN